LEGVGLGELNSNLLSGELVEDGRHGFQFVFGLLSVEGVEEELGVLLAVEGNSDLSSGDSSGEALY